MSYYVFVDDDFRTALDHVVVDLQRVAAKGSPLYYRSLGDIVNFSGSVDAIWETRVDDVGGEESSSTFEVSEVVDPIVQKLDSMENGMEISITSLFVAVSLLIGVVLGAFVSVVLRKVWNR